MYLSLITGVSFVIAITLTIRDESKIKQMQALEEIARLPKQAIVAD